MSDSSLIKEWNKRLFEIYRQENLTSIRGFGEEDEYWKHNGVDLYDKFVSIVVRPQTPALQFDPHGILDELISISDQILHFTSHTFLYGNLINNPLVDGHQPQGYANMVYPNIQNLEAKRFDLYVDAVFEKIYGYWTRIGHLLNHYLPASLRSNSVDFARVIEQLPIQLSKFHLSPNYQWLIDFKNNGHKTFNDQRRTIVHHKTTGTTFMERHLACKSRVDIEALMEERFAIPSFFKEQIYLSITGLDIVLDFIAEITGYTQPIP